MREREQGDRMKPQSKARTGKYDNIFRTFHIPLERRITK
jgi:hypothetical protein